MKAKDVASRYDLDLPHFIGWLNGSGYKWSSSMGTVNIDDRQDIDEIVAAYRYEITSAHEMAEGVVDILITTGFSFDGYTIVKYSGIISADEFASYLLTKPGDPSMVAFAPIRRNALAKLKESAFALGCNAVIGVDFNYLALPQLYGIAASGNAVIIERIGGQDPD